MTIRDGQFYRIRDVQPELMQAIEEEYNILKKDRYGKRSDISSKELEDLVTEAGKIVQRRRRLG